MADPTPSGHHAVVRITSAEPAEMDASATAPDKADAAVTVHPPTPAPQPTAQKPRAAPHHHAPRTTPPTVAAIATASAAPSPSASAPSPLLAPEARPPSGPSTWFLEEAGTTTPSADLGSVAEAGVAPAAASAPTPTPTPTPTIGPDSGVTDAGILPGLDDSGIYDFLNDTTPDAYF